MMASDPIFILGATGSGKSALAVELAERLGNAEIISADAYQVYRSMPLLTAAPEPDLLRRIPHHLIGFMDVSENNDAAKHARRALEIIRQIHARGHRVIITGGSGLYVKFLSHGISPAPPSDPQLRRELEDVPLAEAVRRLQELDPEGASRTNLQNPRYVRRNLEIVLAGGKPLSYWQRNWNHPPLGPGFLLVRDTAELDSRIARRTHDMILAGVIDEVRALPTEISHTAQQTLGLSLVRSFLADEISLPELESSLALATRRYAKRQRTWLRRESWLSPIPTADPAALSTILRSLNANTDDKRS